MPEDRRQYNEKPQWFIDEMEELRTHIDTKADGTTVGAILKYGVPVIGAIVATILNLYILYYSGLAELKTDVKVISTDLSNVKEDIVDIKKVLFSADITQ